MAMQASLNALPHAGIVGRPPYCRTRPCSLQIQHHATSTLIGNAPSRNSAHVDTSIRTWRWRQGGLETCLQLILPSTTCNIHPVSFLSCFVNLGFFTLLLPLKLDKSLFLPVLLAVLCSYFPFFLGFASIATFSCQALHLPQVLI
jgi:hypothetical protein